MSSSTADNSLRSQADPCQFLPWDTEFFKFNIARVNGNKLTDELLRAIETWCQQKQIRCLYFLARSDDSPTVVLAEQSGFHLADIRMTFTFKNKLANSARRTDPHPNAVSFRSAIEKDIPHLQAIAQSSHTDTRFFFDENFNRNQSQALYEIWIEKSVMGFANHVLIAETDGKVVGYISCHIVEAQDNQPQTGSIGLIAVAGNQQGKGIGKRLVTLAIDWFLVQGVETISVVTQGRNVIAQKLYVKCGFMPSQLELYYHRWF